MFSVESWRELKKFKGLFPKARLHVNSWLQRTSSSIAADKIQSLLNGLEPREAFFDPSENI
jgi:hypothetical protein